METTPKILYVQHVGNTNRYLFALAIASVSISGNNEVIKMVSKIYRWLLQSYPYMRLIELYSVQWAV